MNTISKFTCAVPLMIGLIGSAMFPSVVCAVQASPFPVQVEQTDGTQITLQIRGNEFFHWYEDTNGFTVIEKQSGYYYGIRNLRGELAATDLLVGKVDPQNAGLARHTLPAQDVMTRARARALPADADSSRGPQGLDAPQRITPTGNVKNVVILMRFSNHGGRTLPSKSDFGKIFNAVGGDPTLAPTGSVRDVYLENSYGAMQLNSTVFGWVTLPRTEQYYAAGNSGLGVKVREAIRDALELADPLINFSNFDQDSDGFVDAIAFVHSGYGAEWGGNDSDGTPQSGRIWSHRWTIPTWTSDESVKVRDYHINPGLWSTSGTSPGRIGVICHETGHFFGLPDLYDTGGGGSGIGSWGMMANSWGFDGSQQYPPHFCAWSKIKLGWIAPTMISSAGTYTVAPAESAGAKIYKIDTGYASGEYLLIENRQPVGYDQKIPPGTGGAGGLAVWHIDEAKSANNDPGYPGQPGFPGNNKHYKIALLQADGQYHLEKGTNRGDAGDVFRAGFVDKCDASTVPNTNGYQNGTVTTPGHALSEISATGSNMSFVFGGVKSVDLPWLMLLLSP